MRAYVFAFAVDELPLVFCHPCTALLALAGVEVGIENSQIGTVLVENLISFDIGMVDGDVLVFLEGDAVQTVGQAKDTLDDVRQLEIGSQHLCIQVVLLHLQLVRVEGGVPRLQFFISREFLQLIPFLDGSRLIGINQVVQQLVDIAGVGSHAVFQHVVGVGLIA